MKIAMISAINYPVPPPKYGGIERVVHYLTEELVKRGHEVTLFAPIGSKTSAKLVADYNKYDDSPGGSLDEQNVIHAGYFFSKIFKKAKEFDIIHNHSGPLPLLFAELSATPILTTIHIPLYQSKRSRFIFSKNRPNCYFISVSNSQRKPLPDLNYLATIYNGVKVKEYKFNKNSIRNHFVFLGRISPEKGPVQAIQAAKMANVKLKIAAKIDAADIKFFEKEVKPLIDGKQIEYIGEITQEEKNGFFKNALGMIAPIQWEDPCPVAFIESMACGVPVIAFDRGSAGELINDGKTGFVVKPFDKKGKLNLKGLIEVVKNINQIDRRECRKWVEENFTVEKMVDNYEKVFYKILEGAREL